MSNMDHPETNGWGSSSIWTFSIDCLNQDSQSAQYYADSLLRPIYHHVNHNFFDPCTSFCSIIHPQSPETPTP